MGADCTPGSDGGSVSEGERDDLGSTVSLADARDLTRAEGDAAALAPLQQQRPQPPPANPARKPQAAPPQRLP